MKVGDYVVVKDQPDFISTKEGGCILFIGEQAAIVTDGINCREYLLDALRTMNEKDITLMGLELRIPSLERMEY